MGTDVKEKLKLLGDTNQLIDATLEIVLPDFMQITKLLKASAAKIRQRADVADGYGQVIRELQYYDIFSQKMRHIIRIHEIILETKVRSLFDAGEKVFQGNLIRLNHLQFQVACFEYMSSVNHIQTNLVHGELFKVLGIQSSNELFQRTTILLSASRKINDNFFELTIRFKDHSSAELDSRLDLINDLYSMESERSVLRAYMARPSMEADDVHRARSIGEPTEDIDLF